MTSVPASVPSPDSVPAPVPVSPGQGSDSLTGLVDARAALAWLDRAEGRREAGPVHAMLLGLNRLQAVNLAFGRGGGDRILAEVARRIVQVLGEELGPRGLVARVSGGEFLIASDAPLSRERWQGVAQVLGRAIARPLRLDSLSPEGGAVGEAVRLLPRIALLRGQPGDSGSSLLDRLDQALVQLQRGAARRLLWADGSHRARARSAALLEADLIGALHRDEIAILYQPQFRVRDGALAGAEALARWEHPTIGRIGAATLFTVAERADQMAPLSQHIAGAAMTGAQGWPEAWRLSLNVTPEDFALPDFAGNLLGRARDAGFAPERLTIEITEQTLIADFAACAQALRQLAGQGVRVALDDFGTGFSNFRTLKALPLDTLKIDRSLVRDVAHDRRDRAILAAMVAMARALSLSVVAEGVETEAQLAVLADEGVDLFQGFLRAGPLAGADMAALAG